MSRLGSKCEGGAYVLAVLDMGGIRESIPFIVVSEES